MKPGGGRAKGRAFEQKVSELFRQAGFADAKRGLSQCRSARETADVEGTPWWVECKRGRRVNYQQAMEQAKSATDGRVPIVVGKDDRGDVLVAMRWKDWSCLVEKLEATAEVAVALQRNLKQQDQLCYDDRDDPVPCKSIDSEDCNHKHYVGGTWETCTSGKLYKGFTNDNNQGGLK